MEVAAVESADAVAEAELIEFENAEAVTSLSVTLGTEVDCVEVVGAVVEVDCCRESPARRVSSNESK